VIATHGFFSSVQAKLAAVLCAGFVLLAAAAQAAERAAVIDIYGGGQSKAAISLAAPLGPSGSGAPSDAATLQKYLNQNLSIMPFLRIIPGSEVPGGDRMNGYKAEEVDFKRYQLVGSDYLVTAGWPEGARTVELRAFGSFTGKLIVGKSYTDLSPDKLPMVADMFCEALMQELTGHGEFFRSTLAFVRTTSKGQTNIFTIRPTGRELRQLTSLKGQCMSPSWSPDGRLIAFSIITDRTHQLGVVDVASGRVSTYKMPTNTIVSPFFTSSGRIAVSLSSGDVTDIVMLNGNYQVERKLVSNGAINVSPRFDRSGSKMVYVSDRAGGPQVYMGDQRLSYEGNYNTDPTITPDGDMVAFSRRVSDGFRIFIHDMATGRDTQASFGPGNDEQPAFAPDGYFLAFVSTRGGPRQIYLTTRQANDAALLPLGGEASFPAWFVPGK
jgi:TolB protein